VEIKAAVEIVAADVINVADEAIGDAGAVGGGVVEPEVESLVRPRGAVPGPFAAEKIVLAATAETRGVNGSVRER
jgi:hypothetical protein